MSIKIIINYCLISTLCFVKTTLLHTPFYLYHPQVIFQYLFTAKHLVIVIVPQNMNTLKSFYQFCDSCKILPWAIYFKENNIKFFKCSKWEMFVWILIHVPSAIALSLFILKSSTWNKINDASYSNLSCGNIRLLIAYNLKLALVPCTTSSGQKYFVPFHNSILCTLSFPHMQSLTAYFFI